MTDAFAAFLEEPRWLAWREEERRGRRTKIPYAANPGARGQGSSTNATTWGTHAEAEQRARHLHNGGNGQTGCGIVLGDIGEATYLCGLDLDSSLDENGALARWASQILTVVSSYAEVSPSGRGLKAFFYVHAAEVRRFLGRIGVDPDKWGTKRGIAGLSGADHGPGIELYCAGRYFTVTGRLWSADHPQIAEIERDRLDALAALIPPPQRTGGGEDTSRSAKAFRAARDMKATSFEEMCEGLRRHPDPEIRDWVKEKGESANQRELKRIWEKAQQGIDPHAIDWPAPANFLELAQVPRFPADFLPGDLGAFAEQQAFDLQAPLDFVAIPLLIAAATTIGKDFRMAPKAHAHWDERGCLWGGCIGHVGDGKTPSFNAAFAPIWPLQKKWREEFEERSKEHKAAVKRARAVTKQWEKDAAKALREGYNPPPMPHDAEPPEPPTCREMITNDATQERVAALLMNNPRGALLFRDELSGWFSSFNQYRPGADEQFYLQCHAGGPWLQHRKSGDVIIPDVFLCVFGGLQPDVVAAALARGIHTGKPDNGLTARFSLLVWPASVGSLQWVDNSPDRDLRDRVGRLFERLSGLDPERFVGPRPEGWSHYPPLRFTPEGQEVFRDWYLAHHQGQQAIEADAQIKGHFAKYDGLFARLALVHHLLRYAQNRPIDKTDKTPEPAAVDAITATAVRDFIDGYLRPHAYKIYRHLSRDPGYAGAKKIGQWLLDNPAITSFTSRDISRKQWSGLTGKDENTGKDYLRAALYHLDNVAGWVRAEEVPAGPRGGRPTVVYIVNPNLPR